MADPIGKRIVGAVNLDHAELTIRLLEIGCRLHRPVGMTGKEALAEQRALTLAGNIPAGIVNDFEDMATAAIEYLRDQINAIQVVQ